MPVGNPQMKYESDRPQHYKSAHVLMSSHVDKIVEKMARKFLDYVGPFCCQDYQGWM